MAPKGGAYSDGSAWQEPCFATETILAWSGPQVTDLSFAPPPGRSELQETPGSPGAKDVRVTGSAAGWPSAAQSRPPAPATSSPGFSSAIEAWAPLVHHCRP